MAIQIEHRDADGNLYVRYLNWNGDRWDWNYNWLDNDWNENNPSAVSATFNHSSARLVGVFLLPDFMFVLQLPTIRPTSESISERLIYFLLSMSFTSQATWRKNFNRSSRLIACSTYGSFCSEGR
jgi:hypothetical protein